MAGFEASSQGCGRISLERVAPGSGSVSIQEHTAAPESPNDSNNAVPPYPPPPRTGTTFPRYRMFTTGVEAQRRRDLIIATSAELRRHRATLKRLQTWYQWDETRRSSPMEYMLSNVGIRRRPACPDEQELLSLALYYFPPRAELKAIVCDFGDGKFHRFERSLGGIEATWESKPEWATVRWIHIPVGPGLVAASLEDMFLHAGPFCTSFLDEEQQPNLSFEVLNFCDRQYLKDRVNVFQILRNFTHLTEKLDFENWRHAQSDILQYDLEWRSNFYGRKLSFWDLARSDLPSQLTEGRYDDFEFIDVSSPSAVDHQILRRHAAYEDAVLVRDSVQTLRRGDGILLTMSPMAGLNILNKDYRLALATPPSARLLDSDYHVLERLRARWAGPSSHSMGTTQWEAKSAEWLLLNIITDLHGTPESIAVPGVTKAYVPIVQSLKRRRGLPFKRHESIDLVREYVACMNEVSQIQEISEQELERLQRLREYWRDSHSNAPTSTSSDMVIDDRIAKRLVLIKRNRDNLARIQTDLKGSLDVLFQLRTIEQNELAIIAESNNKAIVVFTIVTIIFLPLSFFTSYFGMNLRGVVQTDRTERYFWAVCGSVTVCIVSLTVLFGFKNRLYAWIWEDREFVKRARKAHL